MFGISQQDWGDYMHAVIGIAIFVGFMVAVIGVV